MLRNYIGRTLATMALSILPLWLVYVILTPIDKERTTVLNTIIINANDPVGKTGIILEAGQSFKISVPAHQQWSDAGIITTAEGWNNWFYRTFNRFTVHPGSNYLRLLMQVGVGSIREVQLQPGGFVYTAIAEGELRLFANDVSWLYWNNSGSITAYVDPK